MEYAIGFLLGLLVGAGGILAWGRFQLNKMKKIKEALLAQVKAKAKELDKKNKSIKARLAKASELAQTQMLIRGQLEMPSKNALHSKYKNDLVMEMHDLEQKKIDILKTILADGLDPLITMVDGEGVRTEIPLSAYLNDAIATLDKSMGNPVPESSDSTHPKKGAKFIVHKGGKDDGTTH